MNYKMNLFKHRVTAVVDHVNIVDHPIDFSFLGLTTPHDALDEMPRIRNVSLKKGETRQFKSNTLHMNNNLLTECTGLSKIISLYFMNPKSLQWINLSFNEFAQIPVEITELENLQILYFHANQITSLNELTKLKIVRNLRSLTLHGNPIEREPNYRINVLILLPNLRSLDFSDVTSKDTFLAEATNIMNLRILERKDKRVSYD